MLRFLFISFMFLTACGVNAIDTDEIVDAPQQPAPRNNGATEPAAPSINGRSTKLSRSLYDLYNPLPGGKIGGYEADSGLDIMASPSPTYAVAAGTLVYSEKGHTRWTKGKDTPYSVLLKLDTPIKLYSGRSVTHVYYTHLSQLAYQQDETEKNPRKIAAGEKLGLTGYGNQVGHLHIGFLLGNETSQTSKSTYLSYLEIRSMLGYSQGEVLPSN